MSTSFLYLITKLDDIISLCFVFCIILGIILLILLITYVMLWAESCEFESSKEVFLVLKKSLKKYLIICSILFMFFLTVWKLIPSTGQIAFIYLGNKITTNIKYKI